MKSTVLKNLAVLAVLAIGVMSASAQAPNGAPSQPADGASGAVQVGQGVGRISLIRGSVSTQRGDSNDTSAAALNAPLVTGDRISTGDDSRAEVQLDFANILRLSNRAQANVASLTDKQIQVQISQGEASYTALKTSEIRPEVDTPNLSVRPSKDEVSFRVYVVSPEESQVTVRKGEVEVSTPSGSTQVRKGQVITVRGTGNDAQFKVADAGGKDDWDKWNDDRDRLIANVERYSHTSPYYTGSQDLDAYGHWSNVPDYGNVWVPNVGAGWAPYRDGRWVYEPYYGWTWVSNEPWGWAPYHYGRWFNYNASWVWWPGPVGGYGYGSGYGYGYGRHYYRPIWAPAYVSFFGFGGGYGGGFGFGFGFGSFGWLPCGPGDYYYPWWGGYRNRINVVNITNIYNYHGDGIHPLYNGRGTSYSNVRLAQTDLHVRQGVSTVPGSGHFGGGQTIGHGVEPGIFQSGHLMTGNLPVVPTRENLSASGRPASGNTMRSEPLPRFFGSKTTAQAESFDHQAAQVQQAIQRSQPDSSGAGAGAGVHTLENPSGNRANPGSSTATIAEAPKNATQPERSGNTPRDAGRAQNAQPVRNQGSLGNSGNSGNGAGVKTSAPVQGGWQRFGGGGVPQSGTVHTAPAQPGQPGQPSQPASRDNSSGRSPQPQPSPARSNNGNDNSGWQRFPAANTRTPEANNRGSNAAPLRENGNNNVHNNVNNNVNNNGWDRGPAREQQQQPSRNTPSGGDRVYGRDSRPTLDMRQPVVTPRSSGGERNSGSAPAQRGGNGGNGGNSGGGQPHGSSGSSAPHGSSGGNSPHGGGGGGKGNGGGGGGHRR